MVQNVSAARKIEIGMLREIEDGGFVRRGREIETQFVVVGQRVERRDRQVAGKTFLAVLAQVPQLQGGSAGARDRLRIPNHLVKALDPAVQRIRPVVDRQRVGFAFERELASGDSIPVPADQTAEVRTALQITVERVVAEHDIAELAVFVRNFQRHDDAAVIANARLDAFRVAQRVNIHRFSIGR